MSALGQKQTFELASAMSALPPKADIAGLSPMALDTPTARPDLSERAYLLTVPFPATVKSLSVEPPVDRGAAEVRCRVIRTHRQPDRFPAWPRGHKKQTGRLRASRRLLRETPARTSAIE